MGSKVTCTTCGKVWEDREKYMEDRVKCGKDTCPLLTSIDLFKRKASRELNTLFDKAEQPYIYSHEVTTNSVLSKAAVNMNDARLYVEVPKAIITEVKRVKVVQ